MARKSPAVRFSRLRSLLLSCCSPGGRWRAVTNVVRQARVNLAIMDQLDLVGRTGETARAFGIDFLAVRRGSSWRRCCLQYPTNLGRTLPSASPVSNLRCRNPKAKGRSMERGVPCKEKKCALPLASLCSLGIPRLGRHCRNARKRTKLETTCFVDRCCTGEASTGWRA